MPSSPVPVRRRVAAVVTIVGVAGVLVALAVLLVTHWYAVILGVIGVGLVASGVTRFLATATGARRVWLGVAVLGFVALLAAVVLVAAGRPLLVAALVAVTAGCGALGRYAQRGYVRGAAAPEASGPVRATGRRRSVLFLNPKSGGGKVGEFDLVAEARRRGVEAVVLSKDDDLTTLAERAVANGAEVLGMAGGDGSQADVAAVAATHGLPFVCIPAGTRNHFALDLNLDRADPRLALEAFTEGIERRVDHGLAGDRFFVNNVSLGVYPHIVQDPAYREGRLKAAADLLPDLLDPNRSPVDLRLTSPDGIEYTNAQVVLVSNNPYRGGIASDGGRRVSLDGGVLGVLVVAADDPAQLTATMRRLALGAGIERTDGVDEWTTESLRIDSTDAVVLAGVDGEAMELAAPLDIRIVARGLRVIVPVGTPETPAATEPLLSTQALANLLTLAGGVDVGPFGDDE